MKEKFAELRFYINKHFDAIDECIQKAQEEALKTCLDFGRGGKLRTSGWWHVTCNACEAVREKGEA